MTELTDLLDDYLYAKNELDKAKESMSEECRGDFYYYLGFEIERYREAKQKLNEAFGEIK